MPTDTVYGLAADPRSPEAMQRLYELKGRPEGKPVGLLVAGIDQASELVVLSVDAQELARRHWPGPLTLVAQPKVVLPDWVGHRLTRSVGVRVPDHPAALELLSVFGPLAVTSANRSGGAETIDHVSAARVFPTGVAVWLEGTSPGGTASTVVDVTGRRLKVIREGPVAV